MKIYLLLRNYKKSQKFVVFSVWSILIAFIPSLVWCQTDSLLQKSFPRRFAFIGKVYGNALRLSADSAKKVYTRLEQFYTTNGNVRDQLIFQLTVLEVERHTGIYHPQFNERASALLKEAKTRGFKDLAAKIHQIIGFYHFHVTHNYHLAFMHDLYTFEIIKNLREENFPDRNYNIYNIALDYYEFFDYENAIKIARTLIPESTTHLSSTHIYNACLLGLSYLKLGNAQAAIAHLKLGLSYLPINYFNNDAWQGILKGSIGLALVHEKKEEKAIGLLKEGIELTAKHAVWDNTAAFASQLSNIYLKRKQLSESYYYASLAHSAALKTTKPKFTQESYQALSDYYRNTGNTKLALLYADSTSEAKRMWAKEMDITLKYKTEMAIENERYQASEQLLLKEKEQNILIRNSLIGFILMAAAFTTLLYNRQLLKQRHQQQQLILEKQLAEKELESAITQLNQFKQNIHQKSELINQFSTKIKKLNPLNESDEVKYKLLQELQHSVILTEDDWIDFIALFEKVHTGFFFRLKEKLPNLSPAETRFIALSRLKYSNKEMAAMLGISLDAVRQNRSRFRKKLNISDDISIEDLAAEI